MKNPVNKIKNFKGFRDVDEIKTAVSVAGAHFFSPNAMKYFKSKVLDNVYSGQVFVTSERYGEESRSYTVRMCLHNGHIDTLGDFNKMTKNAAIKLAKGITPTMCKIIDMGILCFDKGKYHRSLKSLINNNRDDWEKIIDDELMSSWLINNIKTIVLEENHESVN